VVARGEVVRRMGEMGERDQKDTYHAEHPGMSRIVESLYCTPETNITLYVNYASIKKNILSGSNLLH